MPREATGSVRFRRGVWYARVTLGPKNRPGIALPTCKTEEEARTRATILAELAAKLRTAGHVELAPQFLEKAGARDGKALTDVCTALERLCAGQAVSIGLTGGAPTFKEFAKRWTNGELHKVWPDHVKAKRSAQDDEYRLKRLEPIIGDVPLSRFTLDDAERAMRSLPADLASASRRQYAQIMHRVLSMAVFPARIIAANPLPRGFLPSGKSTKALTYLYPSEDAQLMAADGPDGVPLCYRVLYGVLAREGMRTGEAERLRWSDLTWTDDGIAALTLDENKTDDPRAWTLTPGVSRALQVWRTMSPASEDDDHVFLDDDDRPVNCDRLAAKLREHLQAAKIERKQLFEQSANRRQIRAHDLRATFCTIALANGRTETWVTDRTGHESSVMLAKYRRAARTVAELGLGDMLPLDEAIPELTETAKRARKRAQTPSTSGGIGRRTGFRFPRGGGDQDQTGRTTQDAAPSIAPVATTGPVSEAPGPDYGDAVERALAHALEQATAAARWDIVGHLARELAARRLARLAPNVVSLPDQHRKGRL